MDVSGPSKYNLSRDVELRLEPHEATVMISAVWEKDVQFTRGESNVPLSVVEEEISVRDRQCALAVSLGADPVREMTVLVQTLQRFHDDTGERAMRLATDGYTPDHLNGYVSERRGLGRRAETLIADMAKHIIRF